MHTKTKARGGAFSLLLLRARWRATRGRRLSPHFPWLGTQSLIPHQIHRPAPTRPTWASTPLPTACIVRTELSNQLCARPQDRLGSGPGGGQPPLTLLPPCAQHSPLSTRPTHAETRAESSSSPLSWVGVQIVHLSFLPPAPLPTPPTPPPHRHTHTHTHARTPLSLSSLWPFDPSQACRGKPSLAGAGVWV